MDGKYLQVLISSELRVQGLNILQQLIEKRVAFGGPVLSGPARFLWKGQVVEHDYCYVITVTRQDLKDELVRVAERVSVEDVCMISFIPFEANAALIRLLDDAFDGRETAAPVVVKDAIAALTFVPAADIPNRTHDSFGDLTKATSDDPTR